MAAATSSSLLLYYQLSQAALGSSVSLSQSRNLSVKASLKAKTYALGVQCFQGQPPAAVAYTNGGDLCAIRPVSDGNVTEKIVAKPLELPSSALAIADVIGTGFTAVRKLDDSKQTYTTASAELIALCAEQLGLCQEIVGPSARFTGHCCTLFCQSVFKIRLRQYAQALSTVCGKHLNYSEMLSSPWLAGAVGWAAQWTVASSFRSWRSRVRSLPLSTP